MRGGSASPRATAVIPLARVPLRGPSPKLDALLHRGLHQPGVKEAALSGVRPGRAILPVELNLGGQATRWITTLTTFGAPQDAFVEELTIEQFHPLPG